MVTPEPSAANEFMNQADALEHVPDNQHDGDGSADGLIRHQVPLRQSTAVASDQNVRIYPPADRRERRSHAGTHVHLDGF